MPGLAGGRARVSLVGSLTLGGMGRVIPIIVLVALTIYCTIEVAQARTWEVRRMPKWLWAVAVIGVPGVGPLAWLFFGRPYNPGKGGRRPPDPHRPPDDNPDFLRGL